MPSNPTPAPQWGPKHVRVWRWLRGEGESLLPQIPADYWWADGPGVETDTETIRAYPDLRIVVKADDVIRDAEGRIVPDFDILEERTLPYPVLCAIFEAVKLMRWFAEHDYDWTKRGNTLWASTPNYKEPFQVGVVRKYDGKWEAECMFTQAIRPFDRKEEALAYLRKRAATYISKAP